MRMMLPAQTAEPVVIRNSAFWPEFTTATLRDTLRLDGTVTDARLVDATAQAIVSVNRDLRDWRALQQLQGYGYLTEIPADTVDGTSELELLYRRAVMARVQASLMERMRDVDTTATGSDKADRLAPAITECYRDARFAIRDLLGIGHTTVALL